MKKHRKLWVGLIIAAVCLVVLGVVILVDQQSRQSSIKLTVPEAEAVVGEAVRGLPLKVANGSVSVADQVKVTVHEVTYGQEKDIILQCTYETVDILSVYQREKQAIFTGVYGYYLERSQAGTMVSATHILAWEGTDENPGNWHWFEGNFEAYQADRVARLGVEGSKPRSLHRKLTR